MYPFKLTANKFKELIKVPKQRIQRKIHISHKGKKRIFILFIVIISLILVCFACCSNMKIKGNEASNQTSNEQETIMITEQYTETTLTETATSTETTTVTEFYSGNRYRVQYEYVNLRKDPKIEQDNVIDALLSQEVVYIDENIQRYNDNYVWVYVTQSRLGTGWLVLDSIQASEY